MVWLLAVDVGVAVMQFGDRVRGDFVGCAKLERVVDCARYVFDHDGGFDRGAGVLADGEDAMIFEQDGRAGADVLYHLLPRSPHRR